MHRDLHHTLRSLLLIAVAASAAVLSTACAASTDDEETDSTNEELSSVQKVAHITTISYAPNSYVIGNAYPGWTDDVQGDAQFSKGKGNEAGASYRWGYLFGDGFDHCAWVGDNAVNAKGSAHDTSRCGARQEIDTPHFMATYTNGEHNTLEGDGSDTHMSYDGSGCTDKNGYGNVAPWRVPATPSNKVGQIPDGKLLKWRYVTRDTKWVLVRDPSPVANQPNWYFVHRGCVSVANKN
jgi:hypothetical protein